MAEGVEVEDMYFVEHNVLPYVYVFSISCLCGYVLENWTILQRQRDCWLQRNLLLYYILYSRLNESTTTNNNNSTAVRSFISLLHLGGGGGPQ